MAEKKTEIARSEERGLTRGEPIFEPFRMMDRFVDEMDQVFEDVFGGGRLTPRLGLTSLRSPWRSDLQAWAPDVEVFYRNNELVVRADLPGLTKDNIKVDVTENHN